MQKPGPILMGFTVILHLSAALTLSFAASVSIARWRTNAAAAYSINMDDYGTQYFGNIAVIDSTLKNRQLWVSFATEAAWGQCSGSCATQFWARANGVLAGNEFVNHSMTHPATTQFDFATEIDSSQAIVERNIPANRCRFFVFPGGSKSDAALSYLRSKKYIGSQGGGSGLNPAIIADPFLIKATYYQGGGVDDLDQFAQSAINGGGWAMRSCHNVGTGGWQPIPVADWIAHLNFVARKVASGELWVAPVQEVLMYAMERERFTAAISAQTAHSITISINAPSAKINPSPLVANQTYTVPLTCIVTTDLAASGVVAMQNNQQLEVTNLSATELMLDIAPWDGPVEISTGEVFAQSKHVTLASKPLALVPVAGGLAIEGLGNQTAQLSIFAIDGRLQTSVSIRTGSVSGNIFPLRGTVSTVIAQVRCADGSSVSGVFSSMR